MMVCSKCSSGSVASPSTLLVMAEFASGWVGGACGFVLGHPFDTLKVRQQALNHTSIVFTFKDCVKRVSNNRKLSFYLKKTL